MWQSARIKLLLPIQSNINGLIKDVLNIVVNFIRKIVRHYTRESGVRKHEKNIAKICRAIAT